jgi:Tfp pilus assembly protein PilX
MKLYKNDKNKITGIALFIVLMLLLILKIIFKNP